MNVTIATCFVPPTNTQGARVKSSAKDGATRVIASYTWDYALEPSDNHRKAAEGIAKFFGLPNVRPVQGSDCTTWVAY